MTLAGILSMARAEEAPNRPEARAANAAAAGLYFAGGLLCATAVLLPRVRAPAAIAAVGVVAMLTGGLLALAAARSWGGLGIAFLADLWGIALIATLCAGSDGAASPFALLYFFAIGHAAAFQSRRRLLVVVTVGLLAFLAPLAYESNVSTTFDAVACIGIVLALLASAVVYFSLNRLRAQRRRLRVLVAASADLDRSLDPAETLRTIAHMAVPQLADLCVIDLLDPGEGIVSTVAASVDPAVAAGVERLRTAFPLDMRSGHPVARVLAGQERSVSIDLTADGALHRIAESDEHERFMRDSGYARAQVFPLLARGRTHGTISFLQLNGSARDDRNLQTVLDDLAGRAAMAFDNARLYAERAQVARTLRRSLMPAALPAVSGLELASHFRPSGAGNEVGGDFYDVLVDEHGCWLVLGDVCGKGAEAAAVTGFLRHTTAAYARERRGPADVLREVNRAMLDQDFQDRFATAILARADTRAGRVHVTLARAGHPAALLVRGLDGHVRELGGRGTLLGVFADPVIAEAGATLAAGDSLVLYTDGLPEAHAPERVVGVGEMVAQLQRALPGSARDAIDALLALIDPDDRARDDIAILCARVDAPSPAAGAGAGAGASSATAA
jgi:hypothetical protein